MGSAWNWIGIIAWLLVLGYLIFIIHNIRHRHIRMIIMSKKTFSWPVLATDLALIVVFLAGFVFMSYQTFFNQASVTEERLVKVKYTTEPLVLQTQGDTGYMVKVQQGEGRAAIQTYTYWTEGHQNQVKSIHASIATGKTPISIGGKVYRWPSKMIKTADEEYSQAFAARVVATYKPGFWNGLGMRVGHNALDYTMIRVPSSTFVSQDE
ncbi:LVIS_2131 family protein [Lapidilactobacillus wuchangensis]|uniref:LVIS_2131 family protein n=1 Tax=Lapidilactobacillus wuchangensis TaxID=2486001 RepID=UPI000F7A1D19|nr:LVIS_2131 family protein [Lapidilactobacillus wuchangensis]